MATKLLLLEDDPAIAETVVYALSREGFEVEHLTLVGEADRRLRDSGRPLPAAAIFDVGLPDGSGLDLCRGLRQANAALQALPVLMLTARAEEIDRVLGLELGADDYLTKPFSPRELCARVRALIRRSQLVVAPTASTPAPTPSPTLNGDRSESCAFGSTSPTPHEPLIVCDEAGQRIRCGAQWLPLTRRELGLLTLLMRHPGRIWPREALLDAVWGQDAESTDRTVDTHVKTLRGKLREAGASADLIVTHRGLGYAIDPKLL